MNAEFSFLGFITVKVIKKNYLAKKIFLIYGLFVIIIFEIEEMRK